ncbi:hypothetical protein TNCV_1953331 [Trichonephila clavipes]|nr:hypothetical protein TNCV_1953331 [Trichonephila clavipes]
MCLAHIWFRFYAATGLVIEAILWPALILSNRGFQKSEMAQAMTPIERLLERARIFIERCETELDWENLSDDTIMDMGCGAYFSCTRALLEKFPQIGCLVAIDANNVMSEEIMEDEFFAEYFRKKILQFRLVDITNWNVLQQITNKRLAFQNMYDLLRPGGHAAVLFSISNPVGNCLLTLRARRNWVPYHNMYSKLRPNDRRHLALGQDRSGGMSNNITCKFSTPELAM